MAGPLDPSAEEQLRELAPRVLGALLRRRFDFAAAEDAVQEAMLAAFLEWPQRGVPGNPGGWLYQVALRRLADQGDSERARRGREAAAAVAEDAAAPVMPDDENDPVRQDDTLILLFTCCHPALSAPSAVALTLRAV